MAVSNSSTPDLLEKAIYALNDLEARPLERRVARDVEGADPPIDVDIESVKLGADAVEIEYAMWTSDGVREAMYTTMEPGEFIATLSADAPPDELPDVPIVGISGEKGSGKSTAARAIRDRHAVDVEAFGDRVRDVVVEAFGIERYWLDNPELKEREHPEWGITPRDMMQSVGKGFREAFGGNFWVRKMDRYLRQEGLVVDADVPVVIDDVRYPNEAAWIRRQGGVVVGLVRPDHGGEDDHESERVMREKWGEIVDAEVVNDPDEIDPDELGGEVLEAARHCTNKGEA